MSNLSRLFADCVVNSTMTGSLLRLQLAVPVAEGQKQQLFPSQALAMPLDGFLSSFGMMEGVVKILLADGVVKTKPQEIAVKSPSGVGRLSGFHRNQLADNPPRMMCLVGAAQC